jgi:lytic murein transglycosylase
MTNPAVIGTIAPLRFGEFPMIDRLVARAALLLAALFIFVSAAPALAASCGNDAAGFPAWLAGFKKEAAASGVSQRTIQTALGGVSYDRHVISLDRHQKSMHLSLDAFMARRAPPSFVSRGKMEMGANAALLRRIESRYGVQPEVVVAIWGMETGFGSYIGDMPIFPSLATLAYDCRRHDFFTDQLMAALQVVQHGYMPASDLRGAWAGEVGQTQFMPKNYLDYAVDFDGDGRRDLMRSRADVLASTANFLQAHGWKPGAGYQPGEPNFAVFAAWNDAPVYQQALAIFASKIQR